MPNIEIFRAGTHTAMDGRRLSFSEADLAAAAAAYDPAVHEAPLVVGHPRADAPAYGWVSRLAAEGGALSAEAGQVDPAFAEIVRAGRYKHVSAAFYAPDSPHNPQPGVWYLKHVGFLGAQPPAVKGLRPVAFAEAEAEGVVEFADGWAMGLVARVFGSLRDWMIAQFGKERADEVMPAYAIEELQRSAIAEQMRPEPVPMPAPGPAYAEPPAPAGNPDPKQEEPPVADSKDPSAAFAEQQQALAQREAAVAARERALRQADDAAFVDGLVTQGRLLPALRGQVLAFMQHLDAAAVVEFGEGGGGAQTPHAAFRAFLAAAPKVVEFGQLGADGALVANPDDARDIAEKSVAFQEAMKAKGIAVSNIEAVKAVTEGRRA